LTVEGNGYPTGKDIAKIVLETFNIAISHRTVQDIRHKMGINSLKNVEINYAFKKMLI
jgi:hypothetical protein